MYKVLIVDDETWVVENYRLGIDWASEGFEVAGVASNGIEALELIRTTPIDLVVTDVRMPMMGGLELIRIARRQYPDIEFAIISGYAEFSYAQKALNYGVAGYCLKPIEEAEIRQMLKNVRERLKRRKGNRVDYFAALEDLADGKSSTDTMRDYGIRWDNGSGMRAVMIRGRWREAGEAYGAAVMPLGVDKKVCFLPEPALEGFLKSLEGTASLIVGVSRKVTEAEFVNSAVTEARLAAEQSFMTGKPGIYFYRSASRGRLREEMGKLASAMNRRDSAGVRDVFEAFAQILADPDHGIRHAWYVYSTVNDMLFRYGYEDEDREESDYQEMTGLFSSAREMLETLEESCMRLIRYGSQQEGQAISSNVVREILTYLHENYAAEISLRDLAEHYYLNPSYLCRTFKRQVGKPFTVYLAELRLCHACELLRSTELTVYEIAERCGYRDYFYFARLFKRLRGVTPSQYRNGNDGEERELTEEKPEDPVM